MENLINQSATVRNLFITDIVPSPLNPRKTYSSDGIRELADNIAKQGLLQPITVRPKGGTYEVVCGERRYRAYTLLYDESPDGDPCDELKDCPYVTIPCIVREMTDEEALLAMVSENLQREDVRPMEEAAAYRALADGGRTVAEIALHFGKPERFVRDRLHLSNLIPELSQAVAEDKMPLKAAFLVAKLDEERQRDYYETYANNYNGLCLNTATSYISALFMTISRSPWVAAGQPDYDGECRCSCADCPLSTANVGNLFNDGSTTAADARCTDRQSFNAKCRGFILGQIEAYGERLLRKGEPLRPGKVVVVAGEQAYDGEANGQRKIMLNIIADRGYEVVKAGDLFEGQYYGNVESDQFKADLDAGRIYPCLKVYDYARTEARLEYWLIKGADGGATAIDGRPAEAVKLAEQRAKAVTAAVAKVRSELRQLAVGLGSAANVPDANLALNEAEQNALDCLLLMGCGRELRERYGYGSYGKPDDPALIEVARSNSADRLIWQREFLREAFASAESTVNPLLAKLSEIVQGCWKPEEFDRIGNDVQQKLLSKLAKIDHKLVDLGCDTSGKPLEYREPSTPYND